MKTTKTSVLMPLSRQARVNDFALIRSRHFLRSYTSLSYQAIWFQNLLYAFSPRFPWSTLLLFPSYFNFHNLTYLGIDVFTHDMIIPPQTVFNYHILNLQNNTHLITKNISLCTINQSHPTHHPDYTILRPAQPCLIRNSKFPCFTTVQQNWSYTTLTNIPHCFKACFASNTPLNSLNFFCALPILALTVLDAPP